MDNVHMDVLEHGLTEIKTGKISASSALSLRLIAASG